MQKCLIGLGMHRSGRSKCFENLTIASSRLPVTPTARFGLLPLRGGEVCLNAAKISF